MATAYACVSAATSHPLRQGDLTGRLRQGYENLALSELYADGLKSKSSAQLKR